MPAAKQRLPDWIRLSMRTDGAYGRVRTLMNGLKLHTVCESARCPNRAECWNSGTATVMILGDVCTRNCRFCAVRHGRPEPADADEPGRVADAAAELGLRYMVITSVTRDDLPDGGAGHFAAVIHALRNAVPDIGVEVLIPDFGGRPKCLDAVLDARPDVLNHNIETVRRLQAALRPDADYERSLEVLRRAAERRDGPAVKSGLMLGCGETDDEIEETLRDLRNAGCRLLTLGQYLAPTRGHWATDRYVHPDDFQAWARRAEDLGFAAVASGPLVRSSYRAAELLGKAMTNDAGRGVVVN